MVKLIKLEKSDAEFVRQNFPGYFRDDSVENIERIIESWKKSLCFCITYMNEKVGIITLGEKQEKKLSWGVMIKEEYRGKGIAKTAFEIIEKLAKEKGYSTIISSCAKENLASKRLHEKVGFVLIKEETNAAGKCCDGKNRFRNDVVRRKECLVLKKLKRKGLF